jgi:hypothetical protein
VTGLLTTSGAQFHDWSAAYRLFSQHRLPVDEIFSSVRRAATATLAPGAPVCAVIDDTLLRRAGTHTPGVAWRRDPLGPRFQTNLVRAQRFLQTSLAVHSPNGAVRTIPVAFVHAPSPAKPSQKADEKQLAQYRAHVRASRLSQRGVEQIAALRSALDRDAPTAPRPLVVAFDGGYTNETALKQIPPNTICIGRLRKDAHLCFRPDPPDRKTVGRRPRYGAAAPTPEQVRADDSGWETISFPRDGSSHPVRYKRRTGLMWRTAGAERVLQLIVIAPLGYRLRKGSKVLYRQPAFLICTDETLDPRLIIETYFHRWDIEVSFREEKTLLGVGQAQVRSADSVQSAPALAVASYAMLLLAVLAAFSGPRGALLPPTRWNKPSPASRLSTPKAINQLRAEIWSRGLGVNFSGFAPQFLTVTKSEKYDFPLTSAVLYAQN